MDEAFDAMGVGRLKQVPGAVHIRREDFAGLVERQRGCSMDHDLNFPHGSIDSGRVADIASNRIDLIPYVGVVEFRDIQRGHTLALSKEESGQIDPKATSSPGYEK